MDDVLCASAGGRKPLRKIPLLIKKSELKRCMPGFQRIKWRLLPPVLHTDPPTLCVRVYMLAKNPTLVCIAISIRSAGAVLWLMGI